MSLFAGTKLGPYEIVAPLGAGGMGEVYRATDSRLGRDVAIKVLPQHLSSNPEVRARFEREAKTVSSLNHPHICVLHDVGREGDTDYLVMELVEGETLAHRLSKAALPTADVLKLGAQIADALDRAHRAGVVHRDLKPANVMLTRAGAKLMDFGLARATGLTASGGSGASATVPRSPSAAEPLTAEGTILGTFQYMAPEQLEGKEADARADLWSLGCVLYEMATGKRAFEGSSQASLIGAIMRGAPRSLAELAPLSPPGLDRLVGALLAKDPDERIQTAHDVKLHLDWMRDGAVSGSQAAVPVLPRSAARPSWVALVVVAVAAAAITGLVVSRWPRAASPTPTSATPQRYLVGSANLQPQTAPMLSPDGRTMVVSVRDGGARQLYRRNLASFDVTPIAGTEGASAPFFSPDGAWIGFVTVDAIKKVPAAGGLAQVIVTEPGVDSGEWGRDGMIYFSPLSGGQDGTVALARVRETGGVPEVVARLDTTAGEIEAWLPELLPDGRTILLTLRGGSSEWHTMAVRPDGTRWPVMENGILARYAASGHLLYVDMTSEAVLAAPFDPSTAKLTGPAVPLTEAVDPSYGFDVDEFGRILYVPRPGAGEGDEIRWLDRRGSSTLITDVRAPWTQPRISPDGKRILVRKTATSCELWMLDLERGSLARVLPGGDNHNPIWSPDGRRIAYQRFSTPEALVTMEVEGQRDVQEFPVGNPQSWTAAGNLLAYTVEQRAGKHDIWIRAMDGSTSATKYLATEFDEDDPTFSPDGRWIAYMSDETGTREVFVRPYPSAGGAWQVSSGGGGSPLWSRDGRELYFTAGNTMMVAEFETRPTLRVGNPVRLFEGGFSTTRPRDFDIARDGRFVAVHRATGAGQTELRMLLNWVEAMKLTAGSAH